MQKKGGPGPGGPSLGLMLFRSVMLGPIIIWPYPV